MLEPIMASQWRLLGSVLFALLALRFEIEPFGSRHSAASLFDRSFIFSVPVGTRC